MTPDLQMRTQTPCGRWLALLRLFLVGVLAATPLACAEVVASRAQLVVAPANAMCPVGAEGCPCTYGGGCDPGLYCDGGTCVSAMDPIMGDAEEYDFAEDMAPPARAPEAVMIESRGRGNRASAKREARRMDKSAKRMAPAADMAGPSPSADPSGGEFTDRAIEMTPPEAAASDPASAPAEEIDQGRQVIYTATLQVSVFDRDAAIALAEDLPRRYGGWIDSRYDYQITLRIRAEHLFEAIDLLSELGVVLDKTLLAEDVTAEYVDLDSRIRILEEMVARLEELLAKATSVEQALQIRAALDRVRLELEAARVRMRQLSELIDFSTLTLYLSPRGPDDGLGSSNDPFPWVDDIGVEWTEYR